MDKQGILKIQDVSHGGSPEVVKYTGTAAAVAKGQCLELDLSNIDVSDDTDLAVQTDNVKAMADNGGIFAGVAAKAYTAAEITANPQILVYRKRGCVCDALLDGTTDVAVGDLLCPDYDLAGLVKRTGDSVGVGAIALEAYTTDATAALKKVCLTGDLCTIDT